MLPSAPLGNIDGFGFDRGTKTRYTLKRELTCNTRSLNKPKRNRAYSAFCHLENEVAQRIHDDTGSFVYERDPGVEDDL